LGAPDAKWQWMCVERGEEFEVTVPRGSAEHGHQISLDEALRLPGFKRLWRQNPG
jgi:hypothetical protein